ncbi:MAG: hypothetical protein ACU85E_07980 [Gammaproteobacteria bacterium]
MRGRMQAVTVASTLALISLLFPPVSIVSSAAVALVTLRRGAFEGFFILLCSSAVAALLGMLLLGSFQFALFYGWVLWLPVWVISMILREGRRLSLAIEIAVLIGVLGVLFFYLYQDAPAMMWQALLKQMLKPMLTAPAEMPVENIEQSLAVFSHYMTGIVAAGSVFGLLFGLFLGRWWQATLFNPGGFREEYLALRTRSGLALASVAIIGVAWLGSGVVSEIAWNVTILLFVLYTFIGAAVLHRILADRKAAGIWIPVFYVTLLMIPHAMLPVALIGLSDAWLNLRNKFSRQS